MTPKAEQTPSQPQDMIPTGPNKTAFIREQLGRDGSLDAGAINRAWSGAGNEGKISDNLVYKTRASMGIGGRRARPRAEKPVPPPPGRSPGSPSPLRLRRRHHPPGIQRSARCRPDRPAQEVPAAGGPGRELHEIEGEIDEMMFRLRGLGDFAEVLEALRAGPTLLVRSHGNERGTPGEGVTAMNPTDVLILLVTWGLAAALAFRQGRTPSDLGQAALLFIGGAWHTFFQWLRHRSWLRHRESGFAPGTQHLALLAVAGLGICLGGAALWAALGRGGR